MNSVNNNITHFVDTHNLIPQGSSLVVGLSGGPDSVFLLHYLVQLKNGGRVNNIIAAHLNHEWRTEADQDEVWCKALCDRLGIPFVSKRLSDYKDQIKFDGSKEAVARTARRIFFQEVRKEHNASLIALAHHLQDQEETFFIRLVRGTSSTGLTCMWPQHGPYIRPLLQTNKSDIVAYLEENNISFLTDPTNVLPDFLRNRIRANVIPALHASDDRFDQNFLATLNRLQDLELYLQQITSQKYNGLSNDQGLDLAQFFAEPLVMQYRILLHWLTHYKLPFPPTQSFLEEILRFLLQPGSKIHTIHPQLHIKKKNGYAQIDAQEIVG